MEEIYYTLGDSPILRDSLEYFGRRQTNKKSEQISLTKKQKERAKRIIKKMYGIKI